MKERFLTWSCCKTVDTVNTDEDEKAIAYFKKWLPTHTCRSDVSETDKRDIYGQSLFVLIQYMNNIEEVIKAGAIPVLLGPVSDEIKSFVYKPTAEKAVKRCIELMKDPEKLQDMQTNLLNLNFGPSTTQS